jgi:putative transposase
MYKPRDESPGYHHVVMRGNNKRPIFETDADRKDFCRRVDYIALKYGWAIIAYCLMENHFHLVILVGQAGLSRGMCELNTGYAVGFNKRRSRINHLFGRRFWNRRARSDAGVMNIVRYVLQNPLRAGLTDKLESYAWSSHAATIGLAVAQMKLAREELLAFFGNTTDSAVKAFCEFCARVPWPDREGRSGRERWQPP